MNIIAEAIAAVVKKVADYIPGRRESLNNTIDKLKQEMLHVQNTKPFNTDKYIKLADKLRKAESLERRAN